MTAPTKTPAELEAQKRAEFRAARNVYIAIILSFLTVCTVAVVVTTKTEAEKTGFRPIHTSAPMSFVDQTYMDKSHKK